MTNVRKNSAKLTREDLKIAPKFPTMELSETPAVEPSDQTSKTVRHAPLVYRVEEIAQLLAISNRDRKSTRLNSSHPNPSRMPSSA